LRIADSSRNSIASPPRFASNDNTVINREMRAWVANDRIVDNQTDLKASVDTFGIRHNLATGAAHRAQHTCCLTAPTSPTTLLNPNPMTPTLSD
jgi:outer membrane receptor for monomeric catechols